MSAKTHAGNVFVTLAHDLCPFGPKNTCVSGTHNATFPCQVWWSIFEISCGKISRQTDRQTNSAENPTPANTVGVGNKRPIVQIKSPNGSPYTYHPPMLYVLLAMHPPAYGARCTIATLLLWKANRNQYVLYRMAQSFNDPGWPLTYPKPPHFPHFQSVFIST